MAKRRFAGFKNPSADPYDVWLNEYERGTDCAVYDRFFARVKECVVPLLSDVRASKRKPSHAIAQAGMQLVHEDRRIGWPFATAATMETEERIVRWETADRLVPPDELYALVCRCADIEPVTAHLVAAEFDVTAQVAFVALRRLQVSSHTA